MQKLLAFLYLQTPNFGDPLHCSETVLDCDLRLRKVGYYSNEIFAVESHGAAEDAESVERCYGMGEVLLSFCFCLPVTMRAKIW